jgi:hypothetical protein
MYETSNPSIGCSFVPSFAVTVILAAYQVISDIRETPAHCEGWAHTLNFTAIDLSS